MWKCPVCERENEQLLCDNCGFDGSCDYESYPTLKPINGTVDSVSARQKKLRPVIACPQCGGTNIHTRHKDRVHICLLCGYSFSDDPEEQTQTADNTNIANTAGKERIYPRLEKAVFWLGWLYILLHLRYVWFGNSGVQGILPLVLHHGLIIIAFTMQLRVRRKGFAGLNPNTLFLLLLAPFLYIPILTLLAVVLLVGMAVVVIAMLVGLKTFNLGFLVLFLGAVYHLTWNMGVTAADGKRTKQS